ncbi:hypothetical protein [Mycoplasma seminis]|uniref:Uncharacterized protein n=1 Tax=Mycoplasma seminis TaxID=512749 RepID=A0ABY9HAM4_9MOLU|nr:hypothetical protein [Mycoplasma seminis]WLP85230.1 hypothetical protein Q8852_02820 [Mycoplasma seminis]
MKTIKKINELEILHKKPSISYETTDKLPLNELEFIVLFAISSHSKSRSNLTLWECIKNVTGLQDKFKHFIYENAVKPLVDTETIKDTLFNENSDILKTNVLNIQINKEVLREFENDNFIKMSEKTHEQARSFFFPLYNSIKDVHETNEFRNINKYFESSNGDELMKLDSAKLEEMIQNRIINDVETNYKNAIFKRFKDSNNQRKSKYFNYQPNLYFVPLQAQMATMIELDKKIINLEAFNESTENLFANTIKIYQDNDLIAKDYIQNIIQQTVHKNLLIHNSINEINNNNSDANKKINLSEDELEKFLNLNNLKVELEAKNEIFNKSFIIQNSEWFNLETYSFDILFKGEKFYSQYIITLPNKTEASSINQSNLIKQLIHNWDNPKIKNIKNDIKFIISNFLDNTTNILHKIDEEEYIDLILFINDNFANDNELTSLLINKSNINEVRAIISDAAENSTLFKNPLVSNILKEYISKNNSIINEIKKMVSIQEQNNQLFDFILKRMRIEIKNFEILPKESNDLLWGTEIQNDLAKLKQYNDDLKNNFSDENAQKWMNFHRLIIKFINKYNSYLDSEDLNEKRLNIELNMGAWSNGIKDKIASLANKIRRKMESITGEWKKFSSNIEKIEGLNHNKLKKIYSDVSGLLHDNDETRSIDQNTENPEKLIEILNKLNEYEAFVDSEIKKNKEQNQNKKQSRSR